MAKTRVSNEELKRKIKRSKARHDDASPQPPANGLAAANGASSAAELLKLQSPSPSARGARRRVFGRRQPLTLSSDRSGREAIAGEQQPLRQLAGAAHQKVRGPDPRVPQQRPRPEQRRGGAWRSGTFLLSRHFGAHQGTNNAPTRWQKRRIYDITNVLEGIGLIEKTSKNNIHWK